MAIIDFFDRGWSIDPSATAYVAGEQQWTFDEAYRLSCRIANALLRDGVGRGSKCAVLAGNDPTAWIVVLGIWRANAAFVPLNPRSVPAETASLLAAFDCDTLFYQSPFAPLVEAIRPGLPQLARAICIDADANGTVSLDQWLADFSDAVPHVDIDLDDVISISPTGGTTGRPKGVMNTHRSFQTSMAHLMIANAYTDDERPVNLAAAPMTHSAGLLTLPVSARAGTVVVLTRPDPEALLAAIEQHRVTEFFLPPTVIYGLLQLPGIANHDYSSLRYFSYGAAPMAVGKLKEAVRVFGPVMTGFYGQSEAPLTIAALPREAHVGADDDTLSS
ncbi:MAG: long-chain fatty acid--CoA ligase, partial [Lysobacteraceae bacterium]